MQANKSEMERLSGIGALRRRQIIDAAVVVLARDGLSNASLSRIAAEAGLSSTGLITYHFDSKDELFRSLCDDLLAVCGQRIREAVRPAPDAPAALDAYIDAVVRFQDEHRDGVRALWRLASGWKAPGESRAFDSSLLGGTVEEILDRGRASGDFRPLHTAWVAQSIQRAVEGFHELSCAEPDIDTGAFILELQTMYRLATRRDGRTDTA
ncbi:TetR/AcrR family transcriptional regulator [Streptomyces sp. A5-4]|uniref:TetR/AcrR family transcriptional regulator n=1 Tax=Streptomyces sp. A5-4 TaxID=3384771 RepID=UPI003DA89E51